MNKITRLSVAAIASTALLLPAMATSAFAADIDALIADSQTTGTLTINKAAGMISNVSDTGLASDAVFQDGRKPMEGVRFDLYRVTQTNDQQALKFSSNADLANIEKLNERRITASEVDNLTFNEQGVNYTLTFVKSGTTGANGAAQIDGLERGVYVVVEKLSNSNPKVEGQPVAKEKIAPVAPYIVTLPITHPTELNNWEWNVVSNPKNQIHEITKAVKDGNRDVADQDAYYVGQKLTYELESTILGGDANFDGAVTHNDFGRYEVRDVLPAQYLTDFAVGLKIAHNGGGATELTVVDDYTVTGLDTGSTKVTFTEAGLTKLAGQVDGKVVTTITAKVTSVPASGIIENEASFIPNDRWFIEHGGTNPDGIKSNKVQSKYGDIVIKKTNTAGDTNLPGAEFSVYRATGAGVCDSSVVTGTPIARTEAATDGSGLAKISNLQLSNWYNGKQQDTMHSYCLVETKAPSGYNLNVAPIKFDLTVEGSVTDLTNGIASTRDADLTDAQGGAIQIVNTKKGKLPNTGAFGVVPLALGALGIAGAGAGLSFMGKRRKNNN